MFSIEGDPTDLIPIAALPNLLPGRPHLSTIHRWRTRGVGGIRLMTIRMGGRRFVSREALVAFIQRVTAQVDGCKTPPPPASGRQAEIERATEQLNRRRA